MLGHAKGPSGKPSASSDAEESFWATIWVEKALHVPFWGGFSVPLLREGLEPWIIPAALAFFAPTGFAPAKPFVLRPISLFPRACPLLSLSSPSIPVA